MVSASRYTFAGCFAGGAAPLGKVGGEGVAEDAAPRGTDRFAATPLFGDSIKRVQAAEFRVGAVFLASGASGSGCDGIAVVHGLSDVK